MDLTDEDIAHLLKLVDETPFDELEIEWKGLTLRVSKRSDRPASGPNSAGVTSRTASAAGLLPAEAAQPAASRPRPSGADATATGLVEVKAPVMGTFYRRPGPGEPPFVEVGDRVKQDDTLCLLEVMKVFTAAKTEIAGVVETILAEDGELAEFGQALFLIRPEA